MPREILEISGSCRLEAWTYERYDGVTPPPNISIDYVEHSPDAWYSNSDTSHDISKEKAQEMVDFLCKHFDINRTLPSGDAQ